MTFFCAHVIRFLEVLRALSDALIHQEVETWFTLSADIAPCALQAITLALDTLSIGRAKGTLRASLNIGALSLVQYLSIFAC